jgi:D-alanyl-lipoteichoic acid acyltransferase DltB (MBOAT superfamily)
MIFSSASFFVFFAVVMALYAFARNTQQRAVILLIASLVFYASWRPIYLLLLCASLGVNYVIYGRLLATRSRAVLVLGITINLAALGLFKYLGFLIESTLSIEKLFDPIVVARAPEWVNWALPLGISFYTFHMLSAMIDVYRGDWAKPIGFRTWCLYVTYFPHLIAGPILRPGQLIDQLEELRPLDVGEIRLGAAIFAGGLVKKVLFADNLAPIVEKAYALPGALDFPTSWLGTLAFAFQIYFDFSGYSEMAIGLAWSMGVRLPRNFIYPYIARNPSEFWRRWHITLSRWLRDYLYISLGGSRRGTQRTYVNLMLTMFLGGLWHGASWNFAIWGVLHGAYLIGARLLDAFYGRTGIAANPTASRWLSLAGMPLTFFLVCVAWVFFRAPDFHSAITVGRTMLGLAQPTLPPLSLRSYEIGIVAASAVLVFTEPFVVTRLQKHGIGGWWKVPSPLRGAAYALGALFLIVFGGSTQKFIYFDF